jgi:hypothetical protein
MLDWFWSFLINFWPVLNNFWRFFNDFWFSTIFKPITTTLQQFSTSLHQFLLVFHNFWQVSEHFLTHFNLVRPFLTISDHFLTIFDQDNSLFNLYDHNCPLFNHFQSTFNQFWPFSTTFQLILTWTCSGLDVFGFSRCQSWPRRMSRQNIVPSCRAVLPGASEPGAEDDVILPTRREGYDVIMWPATPFLRPEWMPDHTVVGLQSWPLARCSRVRSRGAALARVVFQINRPRTTTWGTTCLEAWSVMEMGQIGVRQTDP